MGDKKKKKKEMNKSTYHCPMMVASELRTCEAVSLVLGSRISRSLITPMVLSDTCVSLMQTKIIKIEKNLFKKTLNKPEFILTKSQFPKILYKTNDKFWARIRAHVMI